MPIREHDIDSDKESVKDAELLAKFNGEYPPTLLRIMNGVGLDPGIGFHSIALQIAITYNALDKSKEDMLALCEGLCEKHESDGTRYNTPRKQADELLRMHCYTAGIV